MTWLITICECCYDGEHEDCKGGGCECEKGPCQALRAREEAGEA